MIINKEIIICIVISTLIYSYCESAAHHSKLQDKNKNVFKNENHEILEVTGKKASIKDYPYTAAVLVKTITWGSAVILNKLWVLTSGYILLREKPENILIRAGSDSSIDKGQTSWASQLFIHPDRLSWKNDVALIKLKDPLKFNKQVKAIKLPNNSPKKGAKVSMSGFGFYYVNDSQPMIVKNEKLKAFTRDGWLRATTLEVMTYKDCEAYYSSYDSFTNLSFCTVPKDDRGPCSFDFGNPIVEKKEVIGIFSGVHYCLNIDDPPIYANLFKLKKWIQQTITDNSNPKELLDISNNIEYYN